MRRVLQIAVPVLGVLLGGHLFFSAVAAAEAPVLVLQHAAQVDGEGVFLDQVIAAGTNSAVPHVRLAEAPAAGQPLNLNRSQISQTLQQAAPELVATNWSGADVISLTRRLRTVSEAEIKELLGAALQRNYVRDQGELELRLVRPWKPVLLPDDPLSLKVVDLPATGLAPNFIARVEVGSPRETFGNWQVAVQTKIWREVWVARVPLQRGDALNSSDVTKERRDVLLLRNALTDLSWDGPALELAESVPAGTALTLRSVRLRPLIYRGQVVDATIREGALTISMKVELLENGLPGQMVRARGLQTRREVRGKVVNEQTILVTL